MKANEFLVEGKKDRRDVKRTVKPRNPVAHAAQTVAKGSGAHKDKKRAAKQGETRHKNAAVVGETKRMSAAVKLQRAWDRERAKSSASYERERMRRELQGISDRMKPKEEPKKEVDEAGFLSFLKSEPPKKKWNPATDSRVVSNKKDDDNWIKLLIDKKRRGIELTNREWHDLESWKLKQSMKKDDVNSTHVGK